MTDHEPGTGVRERDEREARFFAWDVPGDAHVVALVHESDEAERSATVADAIATSVARRREHTLLLSAEAGPSPLDELLGAGSSQGLPAALDGRVRLTDVAVQRVDRPFVYLPGGGDAGAMRALLEDEVLASFVGRVRERGGTLFIVVSEDTLQIESLRTLIDGYVALGDVALVDKGGELAQFGRVRFDNGDAPPHRNGGEARVPEVPGLPPLPGPELASEPAPDEAAESQDVEGVPEPHAPIEGDGTTSPDDEGPSDVFQPTTAAAVADPAGDRADATDESASQAERADDGWQRHRKNGAFPTRPVAIGAVAVLAVAAGWWFFAGGFGGNTGSGGSSAGTTPAAGSGTVQTTPPPASAGPSFDAVAAAAAFDAAPPLGHSVMIASFAVPADAEERLRDIRAADAGLYFIAPTPVRGVLYHRIFAGALDNRAAAVTRMNDLVSAGIKDEAGAWHIRPATLAFDLGLFPDRDAAQARVDDLAVAGVPAYVLRATDGDGPFRVYGGAYTDAQEAGPMSRLLTAAGEPADLIERRGSAAR